MIQSTRRLIVYTAILVVGLTVSLAFQDPMQVGPTIYKLLFQNEHVRVFEVRSKPGAKIATHSHPHHVVYLLDDGKLKLSSPDDKAVEVALNAGQTLWSPAETHAAENVGSTDPFARRRTEGVIEQAVSEGACKTSGGLAGTLPACRSTPNISV